MSVLETWESQHLNRFIVSLGDVSENQCKSHCYFWFASPSIPSLSLSPFSSFLWALTASNEELRFAIPRLRFQFL